MILKSFMTNKAFLHISFDSVFSIMLLLLSKADIPNYNRENLVLQNLDDFTEVTELLKD